MDKLRDIFRDADSKKIVNLIVGLVIGIILLMLGSTYYKKDKKIDITTTNLTPQKETSEYMDTYEKALEKRLEEALSLIEGVGRVKVLLTLSYSSEIIISQDTVMDESITKETDKEGGNREIINKKIDTKNILINDGGQQKPLVLKEIEPKIEGVIVVAEGGNTAEAKETLMKSVQTVLAVEPHKIQVLKMK